MTETKSKVGRKSYYGERMLRTSVHLPPKMLTQVLRICVRKHIQPSAFYRDAVAAAIAKETAPTVSEVTETVEAGLPFGSAG